MPSVPLQAANGSHPETPDSQPPLAFDVGIAGVLLEQPWCNYFVIGTLWDSVICTSCMCSLCCRFCFTSPESPQIRFCCISAIRTSPLVFCSPTWLDCLVRRGQKVLHKSAKWRSQKNLKFSSFLLFLIYSWIQQSSCPPPHSSSSTYICSESFLCAVAEGILGEQPGSKTSEPGRDDFTTELSAAVAHLKQAPCAARHDLAAGAVGAAGKSRTDGRSSSLRIFTALKVKGATGGASFCLVPAAGPPKHGSVPNYQGLNGLESNPAVTIQERLSASKFICISAETQRLP